MINGTTACTKCLWIMCWLWKTVQLGVRSLPGKYWIYITSNCRNKLLLKRRNISTAYIKCHNSEITQCPSPGWLMIRVLTLLLGTLWNDQESCHCRGSYAAERLWAGIQVFVETRKIGYINAKKAARDIPPCLSSSWRDERMVHILLPLGTTRSLLGSREPFLIISYLQPWKRIEHHASFRRYRLGGQSRPGIWDGL